MEDVENHILSSDSYKQVLRNVPENEFFELIEEMSGLEYKNKEYEFDKMLNNLSDDEFDKYIYLCERIKQLPTFKKR